METFNVTPANSGTGEVQVPRPSAPGTSPPPTRWWLVGVAVLVIAVGVIVIAYRRALFSVFAPTPPQPPRFERTVRPEEYSSAQWLKIDQDGDGLTDEEERQGGTNFHNPDTDGDVLFDGEEVLTWHTDPKNPDTDGDGHKDGDEVRSGYNPNGPGQLTPPNQPPPSTTP